MVQIAPLLWKCVDLLAVSTELTVERFLVFTISISSANDSGFTLIQKIITYLSSSAAINILSSIKLKKSRGEELPVWNFCSAMCNNSFYPDLFQDSSHGKHLINRRFTRHCRKPIVSSAAMRRERGLRCRPTVPLYRVLMSALGHHVCKSIRTPLPATTVKIVAYWHWTFLVFVGGCSLMHRGWRVIGVDARTSECTHIYN